MQMWLSPYGHRHCGVCACDCLSSARQKDAKSFSALHIMLVGVLGGQQRLRSAAGGTPRCRVRVLSMSVQIRYMLGDAGRSFVVGYGKDPPLRAHHRGASCRPGGCSNAEQGSPDPNPNVISGSLIGGAQAATACHGFVHPWPWPWGCRARVSHPVLSLTALLSATSLVSLHTICKLMLLSAGQNFLTLSTCTTVGTELGWC